LFAVSGRDANALSDPEEVEGGVRRGYISLALGALPVATLAFMGAESQTRP
jgi:hypothetical protein